MPWIPEVCGTVDAPRAVRRFSRALFFRLPLPEEIPEFAAAIDAMRRRWRWLLAGYVIYVLLLVVPGLLRERNAWYHATAVVVPHVMLYLVAMMVAYSWVGFRINLSNFGEYIPKYRQQQRKLQLALLGAIFGAAGAVVGYRFGAGSDAGFVGAMVSAVGQWITDTFSPWVLVLLFVVAITGVPELVAQLRFREHKLARKLGEAEATRERMARATAEGELRLLQAQVEPHFLYNTLANLRYLVQTGSPDALKMTDALIEYLRTSVPDMRARHVTLGREVEHARHFLEIMTMRMGGRLRYAIEVDPALREVPLPPLVVLTLVENAVKHGIAPRVEGGSVTVRALRDGEFVELDVEDDGVGLNQAEGAAHPLSTGTGLANVTNRFGIVYGESASLALMPLAADGSGMRARLRFPTSMPEASSTTPRIVVLEREEGERLLALAGSAAQPHPSATATAARPAE